MLANPSVGLSESEAQDMYRTINFAKPSMLNSSKGEKPLSMWDKMTLYDLQKKKIEDLAHSQQSKAQQKFLRTFYDHQVEQKNMRKSQEKAFQLKNRQ